MKKALVILLTFLIAVLAFTGCSAKNNDANDQTGSPKNVSAVNENWKKTTITTDSAKVADVDAIAYIKQYSAKELSLSDDDFKNCDFLVSGTGYKIKNDYYVKVSAVIKHENGKDADGKSLFTFDNKGEYYIRYDGKQVLKKDMTKDTNEYVEMKVKKIPETTTAADGKETATTAKAESTTKK